MGGSGSDYGTATSFAWKHRSSTNIGKTGASNRIAAEDANARSQVQATTCRHAYRSTAFPLRASPHGRVQPSRRPAKPSRALIGWFDRSPANPECLRKPRSSSSSPSSIFLIPPPPLLTPPVSHAFPHGSPGATPKQARRIQQLRRLPENGKGKRGGSPGPGRRGKNTAFVFSGIKEQFHHWMVLQRCADRVPRTPVLPQTTASWAWWCVNARGRR